MKKILFIAIISILGYNSVYFKKLSEVKKQQNIAFDFNIFADSLYHKGILKTEKVVNLDALLVEIEANADAAFKKHGNRLGIGTSAFFMVETQGEILSIADDKISIGTTKNGVILVDSKYIFGNAIRDASGLVKLTDFKTNADFNKVSEALNTLIREKALPPTIQKLKIGDEITVMGALKLSKKENLDLKILPVKITMTND